MVAVEAGAAGLMGQLRGVKRDGLWLFVNGSLLFSGVLQDSFVLWRSWRKVECLLNVAQTSSRAFCGSWGMVRATWDFIGVAVAAALQGPYRDTKRLSR